MKPNYKGPGVGIWALALAFEFAVGALMIFLGSDSVPEITDNMNGFDASITDAIAQGGAANAVYIMGWLHLLLAAACSVFVTLGLFVCGIFMCPLCIFGWIQTFYCAVCTLVTGIYLRKYLDKLPLSADTIIDLPSDSNDVFVAQTGDVFFAQLNSGGLLAASVLSFVAGVLLARASRVSSGESVPGTSM